MGRLKDAGASAGGVVADHPLPAALIGAGLSWLLLERRVKSGVATLSRRVEENGIADRARETFEEVSDRVRGATESLGSSLAGRARAAGETLAEAAEFFREGTARVGEYTVDGARAAGGKVRDGAAAIGEQARRGYEYGRDGAARSWQQHPLAMGLAALSAGVAIGLLLPRTRRENEVMGRQSDALTRQARTAGGTLVERGRKVVSSATDALREEAQGEGFGPEEVVRKVRRIADHVQEATRTAARRERFDAASVLSDARAATADADPSAAGEDRAPSRRRKRKAAGAGETPNG